MKVIGIAGISYDLVLRVDQFPKVDSKVISQFAGNFAGGYIANATEATARLGVETGYVGWLGDDAEGAMLRDRFVNAGVDVSGLRMMAGDTTPFTVIMLNPAGERIILVPDFPLYNCEFDTDQLAYLRTADLIYTYPRSIAWCRTLVECLQAKRGHLVLDIEHPGSLTADELREIIGMTRIAFVSGAVLNRLGVASIDQIATDGWLIQTLGARGSVGFSQAAGLHAEPARRVSVADTTGAGDCFHAGVVAAFARGAGLAEALRFATAAASLKVQHVGARNGLPTRAQVEALL